MSLVIRAATPDDAALIHRFICELAAYERAPAEMVEATPASLRAQLTEPRPPFECLIAESAGQPSGFALFFETYSTWRGRRGIWLEDLFVRESERGHGIGKALLAHVAAIAFERGSGRLEWAVLDWNTPAIDFYLGLGAEAMSAWTIMRLSGEPLAALGRGPRS